MKSKRIPERADRENPAWTKETFGRARKARDVLPEIFGKSTAAKMLKPRGRPKSGAARTSISLRLPPDTLARWKATGPGWQTRMAEALLKAL
ncbi:MAG: BrnA antitoxin family protein [Steroidobacteraceae bacterium]